MVEAQQIEVKKKKKTKIKRVGGVKIDRNRK